MDPTGLRSIQLVSPRSLLETLFFTAVHTGSLLILPQSSLIIFYDEFFFIITKENKYAGFLCKLKVL